MAQPLYRPAKSSLNSALIKSSTMAPSACTKDMPCEPFHRLFTTWLSNEELPLKYICLKAIAMMPISFMTRLSELAPCHITVDSDTGGEEHLILSKHQLAFHDDSALAVVFFGIKYDTRTGLNST